MASTPAYPSTPNTSQVQIQTASTSRSTPTNASACFTAGSAGSVCYRALVKATGTTTAGFVFFWVYDGSSYRLIQEVPIPAITPSSSIASFEDEIPFSDMILESGWSLRTSTYNAETFNVVAFGADF